MLRRFWIGPSKPIEPVEHVEERGRESFRPLSEFVADEFAEEFPVFLLSLVGNKSCRLINQRNNAKLSGGSHQKLSTKGHLVLRWDKPLAVLCLNNRITNINQ